MSSASTQDGARSRPVSTLTGTPAMPSVGAMIVNFNGGEKILKCLNALREQTLSPAEIIVVDNGSTDGSPQQIEKRFPQCRVIDMGGNLGLSRARNTGIEALSSDLVLSIDSDIYLETDCLERLVRAHLDNGATLVCPRILLLPGAEVVQCDGASIHFLGVLALRHAYRPAEELATEPTEVGGCIGACLLFSREQAVDAGGFDELFFFYHEDLEFSYKLRARGYKLYCQPRARVLHDLGSGYSGLSFRGRGRYPTRRAYLGIRHRWLVVLTHYRLRTLLILAPALLSFEAATFVMSIARGWLGAWGRALWWVLRHNREIRQRRAREQARRQTPDRTILVGGKIPLAPGFTRNRLVQVLIDAFSTVLNIYWKATRKLVG